MAERMDKGRFRFWCQKVLPTIYDDSLSYYELLCKVAKSVDDVIENTSGLVEEFNALKEYVDHYFDTTDFQAMVDAKLDEMAENGTLDELLVGLIVDFFSIGTPEMKGAKGDGVTDDAQAIQDAFNSYDCVVFSNKTYYVGNNLDASNCDMIIGNGAVIKGNVEGWIINVDKFSYESLGGAGECVEGDTSFALIGLNAGDDIGLLSSSLFNVARSAYKDGEFNTLITPRVLEHGWYATYAEDTTACYKLNFGKFGITGDITVENSYTGDLSGAVNIKGIKGGSFSGLKCVGYGSHAMILNRCYKCTVTGVVCEQITSVTHGTDYGLAIVNSQDIDVQGYFTGYRHGITIAGDSNALNIVNRNIKLAGEYYNDCKGSGVAALSLHGNAEYIDISGISGSGFNLGGKNINLHDFIAHGSMYGLAIYCAEMVVGDIRIEDGVIIAPARYAVYIDSKQDDNGGVYNVFVNNVKIKGCSNGILTFVCNDIVDTVVVRMCNVIADSTARDYTFRNMDTRSVNPEIFMVACKFDKYWNYGGFKLHSDILQSGSISIDINGAISATGSVSITGFNSVPNARVSMVNGVINDAPLICGVGSGATSSSIPVFVASCDGSIVNGSVDVDYEVYFR